MKSENFWTVYIIQTTTGKLYTGITNNMERRFNEHKSHKQGARFFHFSEAQDIMFKETHPNRSEASIREAEIKKLSRAQKMQLIESGKK